MKPSTPQTEAQMVEALKASIAAVKPVKKSGPERFAALVIEVQRFIEWSRDYDRLDEKAATADQARDCLAAAHAARDRAIAVTSERDFQNALAAMQQGWARDLAIVGVRVMAEGSR